MKEETYCVIDQDEGEIIKAGSKKDCIEFLRKRVWQEEEEEGYEHTCEEEIEALKKGEAEEVWHYSVLTASKTAEIFS